MQKQISDDRLAHKMPAKNSYENAVAKKSYENAVCLKMSATYFC